jgi:enoyl-CoA hydratase/carnithine racemase
VKRFPVLACDMRFASREKTRLGQPEVGVGLHPAGGGTERLPHLVGRGRALDTAERYGYVNRALADAELDGFVDALARRIVSFNRRAIAAARTLVNQVSLPSADRLLDAITSFETALTWPEAQQRIKALLERGNGKSTLRIGGPRYSARCLRPSHRVRFAA